MTNQKMRHKRSKTTAVFFTFLIIVVTFTVWLTMALLTAKSDYTRNTFTLGKGVAVSLEEPKFEQIATNKVINFSPGDTIDKDPTISIENGLDEEYIAATVFYYIDLNGDGIYSDDECVSYSDFKTYASIGTYIDEKGGFVMNRLGDGWFTVDDYETFFYGEGTEQNGKEDGMIEELIPFEKEKDGEINQTTLFDKVRVAIDVPLYEKDTYNLNGKQVYKKGQPISFQIQVKAYAVQAGDGITWQQATSDFKNVFKLNVGSTTDISDTETEQE